MTAKLSFMYKSSGGCRHEHFCSGCRFLNEKKYKKRTAYFCGKYISDDAQSEWKPGYIACKFWEEKESENQPEAADKTKQQDRLSKKTRSRKRTSVTVEAITSLETPTREVKGQYSIFDYASKNDGGM